MGKDKKQNHKNNAPKAIVLHEKFKGNKPKENKDLGDREELESYLKQLTTVQTPYYLFNSARTFEDGTIYLSFVQKAQERSGPHFTFEMRFIPELTPKLYRVDWYMIEENKKSIPQLLSEHDVFLYILTPLEEQFTLEKAQEIISLSKELCIYNPSEFVKDHMEKVKEKSKKAKELNLESKSKKRYNELFDTQIKRFTLDSVQKINNGVYKAVFFDKENPAVEYELHFKEFHHAVSNIPEITWFKKEGEEFSWETPDILSDPMKQLTLLKQRYTLEVVKEILKLSKEIYGKVTGAEATKPLIEPVTEITEEMKQMEVYDHTHVQYKLSDVNLKYDNALPPNIDDLAEKFKKKNNLEEVKRLNLHLAFVFYNPKLNKYFTGKKKSWSKKSKKALYFNDTSSVNTFIDIIVNKKISMDILYNLTPENIKALSNSELKTIIKTN